MHFSTEYYFHHQLNTFWHYYSVLLEVCALLSALTIIASVILLILWIGSYQLNILTNNSVSQLNEEKNNISWDMGQLCCHIYNKEIKRQEMFEKCIHSTVVFMSQREISRLCSPPPITACLHADDGGE